PRPPLFPYTTLFRSRRAHVRHVHLRSADAETDSLGRHFGDEPPALAGNLVRRNELKIGRSFDHHARAAVENDLRQTRFEPQPARDRKSTRLNSSHEW